LRYLREFRVKQPEVKEGETLTVQNFAVGDHVDIIGTSKGKGFAGGMKRHGFGGGPITHGQSDRQRAIGAIGAHTYPGRVFKGKRMPGHMGVQRVTVQNLKVVLVDAEKNLLAVYGAVAGGKGSVVSIRETRKA
jgi:large subunit ribosomal protein L3